MLDGAYLESQVHGQRYRCGTFELVRLDELRARVAAQPISSELLGPLQLSNVVGDVQKMHLDSAYAGALFQVASQFNCLEMPSPDVTPEQGVTAYAYDRTQGPACAIAAGAATIYRNAFVPVGDQVGQSQQHQLNGLADLGAALSAVLGLSVTDLWEMRNGYALCTAQGLSAITQHLSGLDEAGRDAWRGLLRVGWHREVEVTLATGPQRPVVSQMFCSALPVAYGKLSPQAWASFAQMVLEATYEATLLAAMWSAQQGGSRTVLLTRVGGGVFGNKDAWIDAALWRALERFAHIALDVKLVSYGHVHPAAEKLVRRWQGR